MANMDFCPTVSILHLDWHEESGSGCWVASVVARIPGDEDKRLEGGAGGDRLFAATRLRQSLLRNHRTEYGVL